VTPFFKVQKLMDIT